jgi:signal transduction histidine kinase
MLGTRLESTKIIPLRQMLRTHQGFITREPAIIAELFPRPEDGRIVKPAAAESEEIDRAADLDYAIQAVLILPIMLGKRIIALAALGSKTPQAFNTTDLAQRIQQLDVLAHAVDYAVTFSDVSSYLEQTTLRYNRLRFVMQLIVQVLDTMKEEQVTELVATLLAQYFNLSWVTFWKIDPNDHALTVLAGAGIQGATLVPGQVCLEPTLAMTEALKNGHSCLAVEGAVLDGTIKNSFASDGAIEYHCTTSWTAAEELCILLIAESTIIGLLDLADPHPGHFSYPDRDVLTSFSSVLARKLLGAHRFNDLQNSITQLQAVRATSLEITAELDTNEVLKRIARRAWQLTKAKGAAVGLVDEQTQEIHFLVADNHEFTEPIGSVPIGSGLAGQAVVHGKTIAITDYYHWEGRYTKWLKAEFSAIVAVPIFWNGKVIGVLDVIDDHPGRVFTPNDINVLELIAPQIAIAIHNAQLVQELTTRIETQHQIEQKLLHSARLAAIGQVASYVAHEINNPLTSIIGFVELALHDLPADLPQRSDLELVLKEAERTKNVVCTMLDFARRNEVRRQSTNLNALLQDVLALIKYQASEKKVQFKMNLADLPNVTVDPEQIKQVLINLIMNAIDAMPQGGTINLSTLQRTGVSKEEVVIRVQDNGEGITAENMTQIFDPFFTTRQAQKGTGLGLSVSHELVTAHGGHIDVESEPGRGSVFSLCLPITTP